MEDRAAAEAARLSRAQVALGRTKVALEDAQLKKLEMQRDLQVMRSTARQRAGLLASLGDLPLQRWVALGTAGLGAKGTFGRRSFVQGLGLVATNVAGGLLAVGCVGYFLTSSGHILFSDAAEELLSGRAHAALYLFWALLLACGLLRWYTEFEVCWVAYVDEVIMTDDGDVMGMRNVPPRHALTSPLLEGGERSRPAGHPARSSGDRTGSDAA